MYFTIGKTIYFLNTETKEAHKVYKGVNKTEAKSMCEIQNRSHQRHLREREQMTEGERAEEDAYNRDMANLFATMRF